jgi:hypothetical protein
VALLNLEDLFKLKMFFFTGFKNQKVRYSWIVTYNVRQQIDNGTTSFDIKQSPILIVLLKARSILNGVFNVHDNTFLLLKITSDAPQISELSVWPL